MALRGSGRLLARGLAFAGVAAAGYVFGITSDRLAAQPALPGTPPAPLPMGVAPGGAVRPAAPAPQPEPDRRVVGYIYGNVPIMREELGEFLIARGGHEKLELLCNKKIIETEAARRGITVTAVEIRAGLEEDLRGLGIDRKDFESQVLPRYNKSLYEWVEDVIRPKLLLTKMCKDRVKVTDDDIKKEFENRFGERRQAKIICWSKDDLRTAQAQWAEASKGEAEFDAVAKMQADKNLAAACGLVKPIGRHPDSGHDKTVVETLYKMKVGEISGILTVSAGLMCIKCTAIVPQEPGVTLDDKMKAALHRELYDKRLTMEIPKFFQELKAVAQPNLLLKGPPSAAEFREGVNQIINQVGGPPPGAVPMPGAPAPKMP
jgi:hypothetical protein